MSINNSSPTVTATVTVNGLADFFGSREECLLSLVHLMKRGKDVSYFGNDEAERVMDEFVRIIRLDFDSTPSLKSSSAPSSVLDKVLKKGEIFEESLKEKLKNASSHGMNLRFVDAKETPGEKMITLLNQASDFLTEEGRCVFIASPELTKADVTKPAQLLFGERSAVGLAKAIIDFLLVVREGSRFYITVIDAKANAKGTKLSHIVQVTLYIFLLSEYLRNTPIVGREFHVKKTGAVIRPSGDHDIVKQKWDNFSTEGYLEYIRSAMPKAIEVIEKRKTHLSIGYDYRNNPDGIDWHIGKGCQSCKLKESCLGRAKEKQDLSLIPNLSRGEKKEQASKIHDIEDAALPYLRRYYEQNKPKNARESRIFRDTCAILDRKILRRDSLTISMPLAEDVSLYITVAYDPVSDAVFAAGFKAVIRCKGFPEVDKLIPLVNFTGSSVTRTDSKTIICHFLAVTQSGTPAENQAIDFLDRILSILDSLSAKKSLQIYLYQARELAIFENILLKHALDASNQSDELSRRAERIAWAILQCPDLIKLALSKEKYKNGKDNHLSCFPITSCLQTALYELLAFPTASCEATVDSDLKLLSNTSSLNIRNSTAAEISDMVAIWNSLETNRIDMIKHQMISRLEAVANVREILISQWGLSNNFALQHPPNFRYPEREGTITNFIEDSEAAAKQKSMLSKLKFFKEYEAGTEIQKLIQGRKQSLTEQENNRVILKMVVSAKEEAIKHKRNHVKYELTLRSPLSIVAGKKKKDETSFFRWFLKQSEFDEDKGFLNTSDLFRDFIEKRYINLSRNEDSFCFVSDDDTLAIGDVVYFIRGHLSNTVEAVMEGLNNPGAVFNRFCDFSQPEKFDDDDSAKIQEYINQKLDVFYVMRVKAKVEEYVLEAKKSTFLRDRHLGNIEQMKVIERNLRYPQVQCQGPPGTGKTKTLISCVCALARMARWCYNTWSGEHIQAEAKANTVPYVMAVTACSNNTVEMLYDQLCRVVDEYSDEYHLHVQPILVQSRDVAKIADEIRKAGVHVVVGTIYQLAKLQGTRFDALYIDEATQMLVSDSCLVLNKLRETGKIALFGDQMQLQAVVKNAEGWRDATKGSDETRVLTGSIFHMLTTKLKSHNSIDDFITLKKNYRSFEAISCLTSRLYPGYNGDKNSLTSQSRVSSQRIRELCISRQISGRKRNICEDDSDMHNNNNNNNNNNNSSSSSISGGNHHHVISRLPQDLVASLYDPLKQVNVVQIRSTDRPYTREMMQNVEADTAAGLAYAYIKLNEVEEKQGESERVFIITPHHQQRLRVTQRLSEIFHSIDAPPSSSSIDDSNSNNPLQNITVSTVDAIQGDEAAVVIVCLMYYEADIVEDFIFNINRLNVAFSRAKKKLYVLLSPAMMTPSMKIFSNEDTLQGFQHLRSVFSEEKSEIFCQCPSHPHSSSKYYVSY